VGQESEQNSLLRRSADSGNASVSKDTSASIPVYAERHYSVKEIAAMWSFSPDAVRKLFQHEPGVLTLGDQEPRHKRRYITLRIPESVVERVHRKFSL